MLSFAVTLTAIHFASYTQHLHVPHCWLFTGEIEQYQSKRTEARKIGPPKALVRPTPAFAEGSSDAPQHDGEPAGTTGASSLATRPAGDIPNHTTRARIAGKSSGLFNEEAFETAGEAMLRQLPPHKNPYAHGYIMALSGADRQALQAEEAAQAAARRARAAGASGTPAAGDANEAAEARRQARLAAAKTSAAVQRVTALRQSQVFRSDEPFAVESATAMPGAAGLAAGVAVGDATDSAGDRQGYLTAVSAAQRQAEAASDPQAEAVARLLALQERERTQGAVQLPRQPRRSGKGGVQSQRKTDILFMTEEGAARSDAGSKKQGRSLGPRGHSTVDTITGKAMHGGQGARQGAPAAASDTLLSPGAALAHRLAAKAAVPEMQHADRRRFTSNGQTVQRGEVAGSYQLVSDYSREGAEELNAAMRTGSQQVGMRSDLASTTALRPDATHGRQRGEESWSLGGTAEAAPGTHTGKRGVSEKPNHTPFAVAAAAAAHSRPSPLRASASAHLLPAALAGEAASMPPAGVHHTAESCARARDQLRPGGSDNAHAALRDMGTAAGTVDSDALFSTASAGALSAPASAADAGLGVSSNAAYWALRSRRAGGAVPEQSSGSQNTAAARRARSDAMRASQVPFAQDARGGRTTKWDAGKYPAATVSHSDRQDIMLSTSHAAAAAVRAAASGGAITAPPLLTADPEFPTTRRPGVGPGAAPGEKLLAPKPWALQERAAQQTHDLITHQPVHASIRADALRGSQRISDTVGRADDALHRVRGVVGGSQPHGAHPFNPTANAHMDTGKARRAVASIQQSAQFDLITGQRRPAHSSGAAAGQQRRTEVRSGPLGTAPGLRPPSPTAPDYLQHVR